MHPKFYVYHKDNPDILCPVIDTLTIPIPQQSSLHIQGGKQSFAAGIMKLFCIVFQRSGHTNCNVKWVQANECTVATHSVKYGVLELHTLLDAKEDNSLT